MSDIEKTETDFTDMTHGDASDIVNQMTDEQLDVFTPTGDYEEPTDDKDEKGEEDEKDSDSDKEEATEEKPEEEQYFTYEDEEGNEQEIPVNEVLETYNDAKDLKSRNEELEKSASLMPEQVKNTLIEQNAKLNDLIGMISSASEFFNGDGQDIPMPSNDLLNEMSDKYSPEKFQQELINRDAQIKQRTDMNETLANLRNEQFQVQSKLQEDYLTEQVGIVNQDWPELSSDKEMFPKVRTLLAEYGFSAEEVNNIADSRQFKMIKDLMGFKKTQVTQKKAIKAVFGKGKLISKKSTVRGSSNDAVARTRNKQSISQDDAVKAISQILS